MNKNERFFGLHFDFHAQKDSPVGKRTNAEDIKKYINEIKPDYIQCDCKGHPGITCYPTKVGTSSDNMVADNLKIWIETAHECDIPIYMHYSGVVDAEYAKIHPEHSFNYVKDNNDWRLNILCDEYLKKLMIPQLKELISEYGADGVWVDGDCWPLGTKFTDSGYVTENMKPYVKEGITEKELDKVLRDKYKVYLKTYVDEIHEFAPDFKIISNWAYTSYMPEKPDINVDFLSGDYYANQVAYGVRYEGRCMAASGKPWDIMSWGFSKGETGDKSEIQLCQEAASVLMLGGGFEVYTAQNKDGSIKQRDITRLKNLGEFVKKRKFNFGKEMISQIGIFYSAETRYEKGMCYNQSGSTLCLKGTLNVVLDAGYTADIVMEHQLDEISKYDVFVVPEWDLMSQRIKQKLIGYAENGGNLVIIGSELTKQMSEECRGLSEEISFLQDNTGSFIKINQIALISGGEKNMYDNSDLRDESENAAYKIEKKGNGKVIFIPFNLGSMYAETSAYILRNFIDEVLMCVTEKNIEIGNRFADVTLIKDEDGVILNLLNQNKNIYGSGTVDLYDEITPIEKLEITVKGKYKKAESLTDDNVKFEISNDKIKIKLDKLSIHSAIKLS